MSIINVHYIRPHRIDHNRKKKFSEEVGEQSSHNDSCAPECGLRNPRVALSLRLVVVWGPRFCAQGLMLNRRRHSSWRLGKPHKSVHIQMSWLKPVHRNMFCLIAKVHHKLLFPSF